MYSINMPFAMIGFLASARRVVGATWEDGTHLSIDSFEQFGFPVDALFLPWIPASYASNLV
jgi:hypothetical protein